MLTGVPPFRGANEFLTYQNVIEGKMTPWPEWFDEEMGGESGGGDGGDGGDSDGGGGSSDGGGSGVDGDGRGAGSGVDAGVGTGSGGAGSSGGGGEVGGGGAGGIGGGDSDCDSDAEVRAAAKDLVRQLLAHDPFARLGSGPEGAAEVRRHHFFAGIPSWGAALRASDAPVPLLEDPRSPSVSSVSSSSSSSSSSSDHDNEE